ncbi:Tubulin polyglutamylase complex subunit 1 [Parelaphostrongylus tenuis]|uniref:CDP-diacylglycerol--glycerol-3-phosphate 3-phosphatidyltransferase n=1 Tax=Parelaphostrongylus tenuis TaxID=148309 RepID=A0AAD5MG70_PARTN|nr:Tubulin polyglutamylase complex subunit 1 [Parelaphostrongylus tenuis]
MEFDLPESRAIPISARSVKILRSPAEFYEFLLTRSKSATERIVLSTLYLGAGTLERALVKSIDSNLRQNDNLQVVVLLDYLRGTRGSMDNNSSTTLLKTIADRASVYLYHTPMLRGILRQILPERNKRNHRANLSNSYFVDRQDRYVIFETLNSEGCIELNPDCSVHPFEGRFADYHALLRSCIDKVIADPTGRETLSHLYSDTVVYPLLQMGPFGYNEEYNLLKGLFSLQTNDVTITMASGYFNCIKDYEELIFTKGKYPMDIITAAPKANGFFGAAGISGYIPSIYSRISESFLTAEKQVHEGQCEIIDTIVMVGLSMRKVCGWTRQHRPLLYWDLLILDIGLFTVTLRHKYYW